jgi:hypothetical protein
MAISKTQPMRPAEIDLIEASNQHEQTLEAHAQSLDTLARGLADEINDRENADTALGERIDNETLARTHADTALGGRIDDEALARANADTALQNQIGDGFSAQNTITAYAQTLDLFLGTRTDLDDTVVASILALADSSETLESFVSRFKIGIVNNVTIPANDFVSVNATFDNHFESTDSCVVFAQVVTDELTNLFTYTLIDCTYSGFSCSIANSDTNAHTVSLGYIAVKVN